MQKFTAIGHLGADPEMRFTPKGIAVTDFPIAINDYNDNTMWVRVTLWEDKAENAKEYLSKGDQVYVEGVLQFDNKTGGPETYVSKKDGKTYTNFKMTAYSIEYLKTSRKQETPEKEVAPWKR